MAGRWLVMRLVPVVSAQINMRIQYSYKVYLNALLCQSIITMYVLVHVDD